MMERKNKIIGIVSSLYMAISYIAGIVIFMVILRYPELTEDIDKVRIMVEMRSMVFLTNIIMYVLFGPVLVLFILFLQSAMAGGANVLVRFSSITGYIWAGSLTASGMIANGTIGPVNRLFTDDPAAAVSLWRVLDTVSISIGNGNGEILGGLMTLGFGIAMLKHTRIPKAAGILGIITGAVGIISLIPVLVDLNAVFGILQLVWFLLAGFSLAGNKRKAEL